MSLAKFIDFLSSRSIYCCRADRFNDQSEGEWFSQVTDTSMRQMSELFDDCLTAIRAVNKHVFGLSQPTLANICAAFDSEITSEQRNLLNFSDDVDQVTDEEFFESLTERLKFLKEMELKYGELTDDCTLSSSDRHDRLQFVRMMKKRSYVSSWFGSETHSMAMWSSYAQAGEGVAITTTKAKLRALESPNQAKLSSLKAEFLGDDVIYVDEKTSEVGAIIPRHLPDTAWLAFRDILFKHRAYRFEEEFRITLILPEDHENNPTGIKLDVTPDLNSFVDRVYLNPLIGPSHWLVDVVRKVMETFGLDEAKLTFGEIRTEYTG